MKSNHSLLFIFFTVIGFSQSEGMSYWERAKSYFIPTEQKLDQEFNDLQIKLKNIFTSKYSDPLPTINRLHQIGNRKPSDDWQGIIVKGFSDAIDGTSKTFTGESFLHQIIKPILSLTGYNKSLNKRLFEVFFSPKHEVIRGPLLISYLEFMHKNNFALLEVDQAYPSILSHLLNENEFELAFNFFKMIYPRVDTNLKDDYKKTIIIAAENASNFRQITNLVSFTEQFLKPMLEIEPSLYNDIFNAITTKYFNKQYSQDIPLIYSQNIDKITKHRDYLFAMILLMRISKKDAEQAKEEWLKLYFDNLYHFEPRIKIDNRSDFFISETIIKYIGYSRFVEYLSNHFDSLFTKYGITLIRLFIILATIEHDLISNISKADKTTFLAQFNKLFPNITAQRQKISPIITKNIMLINNHPNINDLFSNDSSLLLKDISLSDVVLIALSHIKELSPKFAEVLLFKSQNPQLAQTIIAENRFTEHITRFAEDILKNTSGTSPTMLHLKRYWDTALINNTLRPFMGNLELKNLYVRFREKEQELNKQGYYTFVHGQRSSLYFPERLYTHLWGLRKKQAVDNFFFAHVMDLVETPEAQSEEDILRKTIHMAGAAQESDGPRVDISRRKKVLFMNYAFFANAQNFGSNSAYYILNNANSLLGMQVKIAIRDTFRLFDYEWIYDKHIPEIIQLAIEYDSLSRYGNLLLIAIPKDKIYKYVFLCESGALHHPLLKKDGTQITDIRIAMETLLKNPESLVNSDEIEFCLIMTQVKGGLDPSTGIQIYPLLSGEPEKLKALQEREKVLLDKITADVKEMEKQQALQRAAKITGHLVESANN